MTSDLFSSVFIGQASQSEIPGNYGNDVKIIIELNILHASCIEYITIFDITLNSTHCTVYTDSWNRASGSLKRCLQ